jgi:hypothetical protein
MKRIVVTAVLFGLGANDTHAYEIDTHSRFTENAYLRSSLYLSDKLVRLGLTKARKTGPSADGGTEFRLHLGHKYYDATKADGPDRYATTYDALNSWVMKQYNAAQPLPRWAYSQFDARAEPYFPVDWMARGAVREDDTKWLLTRKDRWNGEINVDQSLDPNPQLNRVCNHFYDPVADKPLDLGLDWQALVACSQSEVFGSAPKWALGAVNNDGNGGVHSNRQNGFALPDAREAMWRALTGTSNTDVNLNTTRAERDAWWATTFRALGSVIHNLQDMAQPQHTRNEPHAFGEPSLFEHVTNERAMGVQRIVRGVGLLSPASYVNVPPLVYEGYLAPSLVRYRDFFSTAKGTNSYTGIGLANYSNQGFFTTNANFGDGKYSQPTSQMSLYAQEISAGETYLRGGVRDYTRPLSTGVDYIPMARESILADVMQQNGVIGSLSSYSIDARVADEQANLLVPRAVGYSAAFIDFFFRGQMEIKPTSDQLFGVLDNATGSAFRKLAVRVRNTTSDRTDAVSQNVVPQHFSGGKFVAVVRFHKDWASISNDLGRAIGVGECSTLSAIYGPGNEPTQARHDPTVTTACRDGQETLVVSAPVSASLVAGEEKELYFDFGASPIPVMGVDYSLQVVYRGGVGEEADDIATGYRDLADPMIITRHNAYDYILSDHSGPPLYRNFFGADLSVVPNVKPLVLFPANSPPYGFANLPSLANHGWQCWSLFAMEQFKCYSPSQTMQYRYTMGDRNQPAFATASQVAPGGFTRIVLLAPLWQPGEIAAVPQLRIERLRVAGGPYIGETLALPQRHWSGTYAWPPGMRGHNAWHSDGYVWTLPTIQGLDADLRMSSQYCRVAPPNALSGNNLWSLISTTPEAVGDQISISSSGTVSLTASVPSGATGWYSPYVINCAQNGYPLYATLVSRPSVALDQSYATEPGLTSGYAPWDIYLGTTVYATEENPAPTNLRASQPMLPYVSDAALRARGVGGGAIAGVEPTPVVIEPKYR